MMEFLEYLRVSYNLWFTVPLATAPLLALIGLGTRWLGFGKTDTDAAIETQTRMRDTDSGPTVRFLTLGRMPLTIGLIVLCGLWGGCGLLANGLLNVPENPDRVWLSCLIALFCGLFGTRCISIAVARLFPRQEKTISDAQLIGLSGRVISGQITTTFGTARVQVPDGPELTVSCRASVDEAAPVKGDTVILINYDRAKRIFDVRKTEQIR